MAATVLPSMVGTTLCFPSQNPNHGSRNKKNCRLSSSTYFNPSIALYQHRLSAFGSSPLLSFCASRGHDRIRARRSRIHIFLPHLVASLEEVEETYVMVKPDGVQRGLVGDIISRFEKKGFLLKGLKLFQCPKELAEEHYKELKDKSFYPNLINYITSGPVVCMAWEGIGVVASARKLIGTTNPLQAEPGTIRGDLAVQTGRNVVHGSDSPDNGHREVVMARKKSVTSMAQQRKIVIDDFSNGHANVVDEIEAVPEDEELPLLESRCYLANFAKRIENWQINDREWALLRRTPFGRLIRDILDLEMNIEIVDALLGFWDEEHCGFLVGGIIIPFTVDDIALITGLPNRGQKVVKQRVGFKHDGEFSRIYLTITIIERRLDDIIRNRNDPNPELDKRFVQQMILYLWGAVLFPSSCRTVPTYMACHVKNLDSIGSYNWAETLHSFLVKEINAKSMVVKERNEGKEVVAGCMNGLCFIISAWIFEHVDFGEDSRPSNPEARPRMLKWAKGCKFWQRKSFLQKFRNIVVDKVCYRLLPKNDEFELISLHSVEHMPSHIGGCDDAVRGNFSLVGNLDAGGPDIRAGCQETEQRGREDKKEKQVPKVEKDHSSDIANLTQVVFKQLARISVLERKIVNLETLVASNGKREIEGMNDTINGKACEQVGYGLTKSGDKGHTVEVIGHPKLGSITRCEKQGGRQHGKRKMLKSIIAKEHHMLKRRDIPADKASSPSMESSAGFERKDADILVNLDDYAGPTEHKKAAIVAPLNYVGRELLTENVRQYLDAFCMKPMQRDDIVFFDWNICIRRFSMVEYLQGGYTSEEIIDAYALILYEGVTMCGDNSASFLYVPPMFLGLYRNKLGSYKTFLNAVDKKSLEKVKLLFLPCHISTANHWLLLVCDMKMKKWIGYDSLYDPRHREAAKEQIMLLTEYLHEDHGLDIRSWSLEYRRIYPQQEPGTLDCGVFVMKFIESIVRVPMVINFRGTDMRLFRPQIAYKILQHC